MPVSGKMEECTVSNSLLNMQKRSGKAGKDAKPRLPSPKPERWERERSVRRRELAPRQDRHTATSRKEARPSAGRIPSLSPGPDQSYTANSHFASAFHSAEAVPSLPNSSFQYWSERISEVEGQLIPLFRSGVPLLTLKSATLEAFDQLYALDRSTETAQLRQEALSLREEREDLEGLNEDLLAELQDCTKANQELIQLLSKVQMDKSSLQNRLLQAKRASHQVKSSAFAGPLGDWKLSEETEVACQTLHSLPDEDCLPRLGQTHCETQENDQNSLKLALKQAQEQLLSLQNQVKSLNYDLENRQNAPSVRDFATLRLKNETNLALIGSLKREIEGLKHSGGHFAPDTAATEHIAALQGEIKQLQTQFAGKVVGKHTESDLEAALYHIKRENEALKRENLDLIREKADLMETLARLKAEQTSNLAQIAVNQDKERKPTEKLMKQIADLELKIAEMSEERAFLRGKMGDLQEQEGLIEEINSLRLENEELSQIVKSIQTLSVQNANISSIEEAKQQLLQTKKELALLQSSKSSQNDLEKRIKDLEIDNEALKASCEDAEQFLITSEKRYLAQIDSLRMEIDTKSALYRDQTLANTRKIQALKQELAKSKARDI